RYIWKLPQIRQQTAGRAFMKEDPTIFGLICIIILRFSGRIWLEFYEKNSSVFYLPCFFAGFYRKVGLSSFPVCLTDTFPRASLTQWCSIWQAHGGTEIHQRLIKVSRSFFRENPAHFPAD